MINGFFSSCFVISFPSLQLLNASRIPVELPLSHTPASFRSWVKLKMSDSDFSYSTAEVYDIVDVVLYGIFIKPLFILFVISLCLARRRSDPARVGFTWMKLVFPFWIL